MQPAALGDNQPPTTGPPAAAPATIPAPAVILTRTPTLTPNLALSLTPILTFSPTLNNPYPNPKPNPIPSRNQAPSPEPSREDSSNQEAVAIYSGIGAGGLVSTPQRTRSEVHKREVDAAIKAALMTKAMLMPDEVLDRATAARDRWQSTGRLISACQAFSAAPTRLWTSLRVRCGVTTVAVSARRSAGAARGCGDGVDGGGSGSVGALAACGSS